MRAIQALGFLLAAVSLPASAANFSGKWMVSNPAGRGGGGGAVLMLNQVGNEVTGTLSVRIDVGTTSPINEEIWAGKVDGDTLTFYVWTGTDQPVRTSYRGTLSPSGDEIVFTVERGRSGRGAAPAASAPQGRAGSPAQVTARRTK